MMPSPFASENVNGRTNQPLIGKPTESRCEPVPTVGFGWPCALRPREITLLLLCDAATVTSQPNCRRSKNVAFRSASTPLLAMDPSFSIWLRAGAPDEAAIGTLINALCVFLL